MERYRRPIRLDHSLELKLNYLAEQAMVGMITIKDVYELPEYDLKGVINAWWMHMLEITNARLSVRWWR